MRAGFWVRYSSLSERNRAVTAIVTEDWKMRFNDGCWVKKPGVEFFAPKEVHFHTVTEDGKLILSCPTVEVRDRGSVTEGMMLHITVSSPAPEVLRVRLQHHKGTAVSGPFYELSENADFQPEISEDDAAFTVTSGSVSLVITKKPFSMTYLRGDEVLTKVSGNDLAVVKTDWKGYMQDLDGDRVNTYTKGALSLGVGELVYGLGEHFTAFTKNGQNVDMWNEDGGTNTQLSYKNIPFYLTNKGYGVFVNHPEKVSFEVGSEFVTRVAFSVPGGNLDFYLFNGPTMKEVLKRYTDLTGKPTLPPAWSFGLWLSTSFTTDYDEKTVSGFIDRMRENGTPLSAVHFDPYWMKEFQWTSLEFDERVFPDPEGMLRRLHEKGVKVCLWINPYIGEESPLFEEGMKNGYLLKRPNGDVWQWEMWTAGMGIVDFTNPDAYRWFQEKLGKLVDMGVDIFKTDFGERIPVNVSWFDGSDPMKMHNYYTYLYNKCVFELLEKKRGKGNAILFSRSSTAGNQKFPIHWGGDCWSDYESMEQSLRGGLSLTMSGFGYWSHDIGGFEDTSTPDVYKRWTAFGLLSSHSRMHGSHSYRCPWLYGEEAVEVAKYFTALKAKLMPYLFHYAVVASTEGIPMMRSMVMEFTEDRNTHFLDKQYMLGDSLLVAPVFNDKGIGECYLPEGRWTNFFTGEVTEGGKWIRMECDYFTIPLFVKENTILVLGDRDDCPDYEYEKNCEVRIFELADGEQVQAVVNNNKGKEALVITTERNGDHVTVFAGSILKKIVIAGKEIVPTGFTTHISLGEQEAEG